jgi:DNA-binding response OmpR family regulator
VLCGPISQTISRAVLYNIGIDAHLASPPNLHELHALLQSLLRRRRVQPSALPATEGRSLKIGALQIHERQRAVSVDDQPVALTPIQYKLLLSLARRPNNLVPIHELTETVWNCEPDNGTAALIATQMARLRAKLRDNAETHVSVVSVPSRGYRLLAA